MTYLLNTPFRNYFFYKNAPNIGQPLTDGYIVFRSAADHNVFLSVYSDVSNPSSPVAYPTVTKVINGESVQAVVLASDGGIGVIYLQDQEYFIQVVSVENSVQFDVDNYAGASFVPPEPTPSNANGFINLLTDGQFTYGLGGSTANTEATSTGWYIFSEDPSLPGTISFPLFSAGDNSIPSSPLYSLRYISQVAGDYIYQKIDNVRSLEQQTVNFSVWAKSATSSTINLQIVQYFGSGGSPSVTVGASFNLTETWTQYKTVLNLPSISGKTVGTGSNTIILIQFVQAACNVYVTNALATIGSTLESYPYLTPAQVWSQAAKYALSTGLSQDNQAGINPDFDGSKQVSYRNDSIGALSPPSVKRALDLLFGQNPGAFPGSMNMFFSPAGTGHPFYGINSKKVATGGEVTTTTVITNTAGSGTLYLSATLPDLTAIIPITNVFIDINICIPCCSVPGNLGAGMISVDVNGARVANNIVYAGIAPATISIKEAVAASSGVNTISVYYGATTSGPNINLCATQIIGFTVTSTLTAQYIIKTT